MSNAPAGWYPVAGNEEQQRYWDGAEWTEHFYPPNEIVKDAAPAAVLAPAAVVLPPAQTAQPPAQTYVQNTYVTAVVPLGPPNGVALAGFLCTLIAGILTLLFFWTVVGAIVLWFTILLGFILSIAGLRKANAYAKQGLPPTRKGLATAGIIIGGIFLLMDLLVILVVVFVGAALIGGATMLS